MINIGGSRFETLSLTLWIVYGLRQQKPQGAENSRSPARSPQQKPIADGGAPLQGQLSLTQLQEPHTTEVDSHGQLNRLDVTREFLPSLS